MEVTYIMKKRFKTIMAAVVAVTAVAFGGISASATTASDVVAAARGAGILETYVAQLENFLRANSFSSDQYDKMIGALGGIRDISMDVVHQYFPEINSVDEFFGGGSSGSDETDESSKSDDSNKSDDSTKSDSNSSDKNSNSTKPTKPLTKDEQTIQDMAEQIADKMTTDQMLDAINKVISTGKELGLDITVEQTGEKSFTMTVKDKDGNVKLVTPIGNLVSRTGVQPQEHKENFLTVASLCAAVLAAGGAGAWILNRKNHEED